MGVVERIPIVLDSLPGGSHMVNAVDIVVNWARSNSLWPLTYGTACCAIEMMSASMARYDISRFGSEVFRASPRQADLILLAGTITEKMVEPLLTLYDQLPGSKYVIAMGACTINGGPFYYDNYTVVKGADRIIPVDVYIPGCPPRPEALFHGLMTLQEKIKKESIRNPWRPGPIHVTPAEDRWGKTAKAWEAAEKQKDLEQAEARAKFKAENPDYQGFKPVRLPPDPNPDLKRTPGKGVGLANGELWDLVHAAFPQVGLHRITEPDRAKVDALPADVPLDFVVPPDQYLAFANFARSHEQLNMELLLDVTAVDWLDHFDLVVHLLNIQR
ncbi:MAG: NADH-quinone oxidoreductase subunit NuoB, partial [Lentisphaerae bacterium]|nr:NADH-quinone oxidoreductase subunit NuoB [Lentisphaerota bacterium]